LYKSKVEYGGWTVNHIQGCSHGCLFPCYAFMMSKRFGRVKSYEDWLHPEIVENAESILKAELAKLYTSIDHIHLSFMTDPFMYDVESGGLNTEVKKTSLGIIRIINQYGIPVTVLTKGFYPEELLKNDYLKDNFFGITLVSLNEDFRRRIEPYTAPYEARIESLRKLSEAGYNTWVSIEPYPTPNIDSSASDIIPLLERIKFVKKLVFGKLNYNVTSGLFTDNDMFYENTAQTIIDFCDKHSIELCIKKSTPLCRNENIFSDLKAVSLI
ncbi:MAG: radical SAM protein, partial [Firmicutes bacterium]|nr:radical SAM protein [Bacillota bacterium]